MVITYYAFLLLFQESSAIRQRRSCRKARSAFDSPPTSSNRHSEILRKYPPSKRATLANQHNPVAIPTTGRLSLENLQPRQITTQIQRPTDLTSLTVIQSTDPSFRLPPDDPGSEFLRTIYLKTFI